MSVVDNFFQIQDYTCLLLKQENTIPINVVCWLWLISTLLDYDMAAFMESWIVVFDCAMPKVQKYSPVSVTQSEQ